MGISSFESFLRLYRDRLLQSIDLRDQYVVLDGSEILYKLYFESDGSGRGNYVTFKSVIEQFFNNLKSCNITPVVVFDGFKLGEYEERYVDRRKEKIRNMINLFEGKQNRYSRVKPCLSDLAFAQVLGDLEVISVTGLGDMDESIALIANLLHAPVVASDTIFCTFSLENGMIPLHMLNWKRTQPNDQGEPCMKGSLFLQREFANYFNMDKSAIPYLLVFCPNVGMFDSMMTKSFRDRNFTDLVMPASVMSGRDKSQGMKLLEKCIVWLSENYSGEEDEEDFIANIASSVSQEQRDGFTDNVTTFLSSCRRPRGQAKVLEVVRGQIEDPEFGERIDSEDLESSEENDPIVVENNFQDLLADASTLSFPSWALRLLLAHASGTPVVNYLPLSLTDPTQFPSPHTAAEGIRLQAYKALAHSTCDNVEFCEFDRSEQDYRETARHLVAPCDESLGPQGRAFERVDDDVIIDARRSYLLDTLVSPENAAVRARFDNALPDLSSDLQLTIAATLHWISRSRPDVAAIEALACQIAVCQNLRGMRQLHGIQHEMRRRLNEPDKGEFCSDPQALHWSSEWQLCLWEAINLNQILGFPMPEPDISKVFEGILFEKACTCFLAGHTAESFIRNYDIRKLLAKISTLLRSV